MRVQFSDLLEMNIPNWVMDPFEGNTVNIDISLQDSVIE